MKNYINHITLAMMVIAMVSTAFTQNCDDLSGNISGTYSGDYCIIGDITIPSGQTATLEPGTNFFFEGAYK